MQQQIVHYNYDRDSIQSGILHIGIGNFHRAHQQFYTNKLLSEKSQQNWGICGAMLLPSDEKLYHALSDQNNEYTLTVCSSDGNKKVHQIGSLIDLIWGINNPQAVIDKIADKHIKIISLTITEGGYNIDRSTGEFMLDNEDISHDLQNRENPKTTFGFIAEGLRKRRNKDNEGITILSCDNLQHNGNTAKKAFWSFIEAQDTDLFEWVKKNVSFPNSMVDRITPATHPEDVVRLNKENGTSDNAPVYCEDFIQWVIEDNFIAGRPQWENVGVQFTNNVAIFENMKLSLLNASHMLLSYPAFLSGFRKVDKAMQDASITQFVSDFMDIDITPYVPSPPGTDLTQYKETLIKRFANSAVSDQVARLCSDGLSKFPVYIMPNLAKMIKDNADFTRVAYLFAAYRHYLKYKKDDNGQSFDIVEPWLTEKDKTLIDSNDSLDFLSVSAFQSIDLKNAEKFVCIYQQMVSNIKEKGAMNTLKSLLK